MAQEVLGGKIHGGELNAPGDMHRRAPKGDHGLVFGVSLGAHIDLTGDLLPVSVEDQAV